MKVYICKLVNVVVWMKVVPTGPLGEALLSLVGGSMLLEVVFEVSEA